MFEHSNPRSRHAARSGSISDSAYGDRSAAAAMQGNVSRRGMTGPSPANMLFLQRTAGNRAVQRMMSPSSRAERPAIQRVPEESPAVVPAAPEANPEAAPAMPAPGMGAESAASAAPPPSGPAAAGGGGAAPAAASERNGLQRYGNYYAVYQWFKDCAKDEKKSGLIGFFDTLSTGEQMLAIKMACNNERSPGVDKAKKTMLKGTFTKTVDWDRFSEICREAKAKNIRNYNADTGRDYATYAAIGTSAAAGGVSGGATISGGLGAGKEALKVALPAAPVAGVLSGVASAAQIYNATQNYDSSLSAVDKAQQVGTEGLGGAADLARFSAGTVNSVRLMGDMAANGTATLAAGAAGVIGGAAYLAGGVAGYVESGRNQKKLTALEAGFNEKAQADKHQRDLGLAAHLGASTQGMNKSKSAMTAAKGAAMIAGGAMLIAAAASPVGPILLAAAAIIGGIGALIKFYRKSKRKEAFVDKAMNIDLEAAKPENAGLTKDQVRQKVLESHGFNNVGQCYAQIVTDLASMLFEGGVVGEDEESVAVIEGMGLQIDRAKKKPGKDLIAKKLHT